MSEKKVGKRLLTWVLVLVMALSLLPLNVLAEYSTSPASILPPDTKCIVYTFYNGDEIVDKQEIKNNESLRVPATPEKEGYQFTGWFDQDENKFTDFGTAIHVTADSNVDLYAKFVPVCYVYFMDGKGADARIIATKEVTEAEPLSDFSDVSFVVGTDEAITGWVNKDNNPVTSVSFSDGTTYLYPVVEKGHWITFESDGGSYVEPLFVPKGKNYAAPTAPTKPGYDFDGWYNGETAFTFGSSLTEDLTLTAHWTEKANVQYTVIHWLENADDDEYSLKKSESKIGTAGNQTAASAKSYDGFTAQTITQKVIAGDGSTIVNVYYKRNVYVINFYSSKNPSYTCGKREHEHRRGCYDSNGHLRCKKEEHQHSDSCLTPQYKIAAKYGANIRDKWPGGGWYVSSDWGNNTAQSSIDVMPLGGKNFYGKQSGYYTLTASYYTEVLPGETGGTQMSDGCSYKLKHQDTTSTNISLTVTDEDRYPITGFTCNTELSAKNGDKYSGANFYYTRNSYDIIFINGGKTAKTESNKKYQQDISTVSYTPTAPAGKEGYEFAGWFDNELCEGTAYDFTGKTMPANNITLYAKWVAPVHTVTFMVGKTTYQMMPNVAHKGTITLPAAPKAPDGDTFLGWVDANGKPFHPSTKITDDLKLYAKFGNKSGYSVTYVTEGSSSVTDDKLYAEGAYATVRDGASTAPAGKVFLYWTDGNTVYYPNSKVTINGNVTLTAVYGDTAQPVSITYHSNFNDASKTYDTLANNEKITVMGYSATDLPDREGYTFAGWNTNPNGTGDTFAAGTDARVDNDGENHLYAQWTINQYNYTVQYYYDGQINDSQTVTSSADFESTISTYPDKNLPGYKLEKTENFPLTISATAENNVIKVYYVTDPDQKHNLSYTVEYYKDGVKVEADTQAVRKPVQVLETTLPVDKSEINTTNKYNGYKFEKTDPTTIPDTVNDGATIKVYYVTDPDQTKTLSYTVEYYKDGVKVEADTQTVPQTVQVLQPDTLTVDKNAINTTDKYTGYKFDKTDPTMIPDTVNDGATIKVYYVKDSFTVIWLNWNGDLLEKDEDVKYNSDPSYDGKSPTRPASGRYTYTFNGWTPALSPVTDDITYTATYKSTYHRPSTPTKPTVEIEDDDALGLNTTDHFAYIVGYGNGEVRPQNNITRAEVATIFFRLLTDDVRDENLTKTNRYSDVAATSWYNTAVSTLSSMGIITGYPDGTFRPNAAITRAEFAAIAARFDHDGDKTAAKFSDIASHWAKDEISIAYNNGWITGYPNSTFGPQRDITRAETMTLVNRVLNRQPETEDDLLPNMTVWTDNANPKAWYYLAVQEATNSHYYKFKTNSQYEKWTELRETRDWTQLEK